VFADYFPLKIHKMSIFKPLTVTNTMNNFDFFMDIEGGSVASQAGAVRLGIARALLEFNSELRPALKKSGLLTRDAREKERRKYGLKKARKAPQFSKR